ncbi:hypothetical protein [Zavarzinella formosa]|uniref:hypothetical protein n=1 Tax=Zavarzinella formosa TaxID=360055 RepID=UPI0002FE2C2B|nr:hypothetical protein [Zavarzinella formosa]
MSWNIEIALVQIAESAPLRDIVPDVFRATGRVVGFEDATSVTRDTDLCASWVKGWGVVIDINCRLSAIPYLKETSAKGATHVARLSGFPLVVQFDNGKQVEQHEGIAAILGGLGLNKRKKGAPRDGESAAIEWLKQRTGVQFTDDFWGLPYQVFVLG